MTIFIPDIASGQAGINLTGALVVTAKATEGNYYTNPYYAGFKSQAASKSIPFVAYHFMDTAAHSSIASQAALAYGTAGSTPLMIDFEFNSTYSTTPTVADVTAFIDAYRALGGITWLVYLPYWYWSSATYLNSPSLAGLISRGMLLWSSDYVTYTETPGTAGWTSYGAMTPVVWQYSDTISFGGISAVDFSAYQGSHAGDQSAPAVAATVVQFMSIATYGAWSGSASTGVTITASATGGPGVVTGSTTLDLEAGIGGESATGYPGPQVGSATAGITISAFGAGLVGHNPGSASTGVTFGSSVVGSVGAATLFQGIVTSGITIGASATGSVVSTKQLFMSMASQAGTDQYGNSYLQGMDLVALPGLTNVFSVSDISGNRMAGIDSGGNITGQEIDAATDVTIGGVSLAQFMATVNAYMAGAPVGPPPPTLHTTDFYPDATYSYQGADAAGGNANHLRQVNGTFWHGGEVSGSDGGQYNGTQYAFMEYSGSDPQAIRATLNGAVINSVNLLLYNEHTWYSSGMYVTVGTNSNGHIASPSSGYSEIGYFGVAEGTWTSYVLPVSVGTAFASGAALSIQLGPGSPLMDLNNYGYFAGFGSGSGPYLHISYSK